jgi:hypothetical protein
MHKLFYSKMHLDALDIQITRYLEKPSGAVVIKQHGTIEEPSVTITANEVPSIIRLIAGDAFQNLRSALDYLVWELVLANKGVPDEYNAFPVCRTPEGFKEAKKRRLRDVDPEATAIVDQLQPHHFGQGNEGASSVFVLDQMANINKHRSILMARTRAFPLDEMTIPSADGGPLTYDASMVIDDEASARLIEAAIKMKVNRQIAVFIQFDEGAAKGYEVMSIMRGLYHDVTTDILPRFERFFG